MVVIIIILLIADTNLLVVVPVSSLTSLVSDDGNTMDTWDAALVIIEYLVLDHLTIVECRMTGG